MSNHNSVVPADKLCMESARVAIYDDGYVGDEGRNARAIEFRTDVRRMCVLYIWRAKGLNKCAAHIARAKSFDKAFILI